MKKLLFILLLAISFQNIAKADEADDYERQAKQFTDYVKKGVQREYDKAIKKAKTKQEKKDLQFEKEGLLMGFDIGAENGIKQNKAKIRASKQPKKQQPQKKQPVFKAKPYMHSVALAVIGQNDKFIASSNKNEKSRQRELEDYYRPSYRTSIAEPLGAPAFLIFIGFTGAYKDYQETQVIAPVWAIEEQQRQIEKEKEWIICPKSSYDFGYVEKCKRSQLKGEELQISLEKEKKHREEQQKNQEPEDRSWVTG